VSYRRLNNKNAAVRRVDAAVKKMDAVVAVRIRVRYTFDLEDRTKWTQWTKCIKSKRINKLLSRIVKNTKTKTTCSINKLIGVNDFKHIFVFLFNVSLLCHYFLILKQEMIVYW